MATGVKLVYQCRSLSIRELTRMNLKSAIAAAAATLLLATCTPEQPLYFGPQFGPQLASLGSEAHPEAINSTAFDVRPPLPGRPGYLETIRYVDSGVKYIDGFGEFFVSFDGQMCFRGLVNRQLTLFENYQTYWCIYPTMVNNVEALENDVAYVNTVRLWCALETPQCAHRYGYPNFLDESGWWGNSITVQTRPFKQQRDAIEYLIYLMGGNIRQPEPLRRAPTGRLTSRHEGLASAR